MAHVHAGMILTQRREFAAAIIELRRALQLDPALAPAHMGLGVAHAWVGQVRDAQRAFEQAVRYDGSNVEAYYNLGLTYAAAGRNADAIRQFETALKLKPDFTPAQTARSELLRARR
jgi:tetratricopeptide (TPR) repeat protein